MKYQLSSASRVITIVAPGDPSNTHTSDVEYARVLVEMMRRDILTQILCFEGHNFLLPRVFFYLRLPRWILAYTRDMVTQNGVIITVNNLGIMFWTVCVRLLFRRRYQIIAYIANASGIMQRSNGLVSRMNTILNRFIWEVGLARCNGILANRNGILDRLIPKKHGPILYVPDFLVEAKRSGFFPADRNRIRSLIAIQEDRLVVGVIGPFHRYNKQSIAYVLDNIDRFGRNAFFLMIGDVRPDDVVHHERIRFVGRVEKLDEYISACDCILIPRYVHFGAPMVKMISAMAMGIPVVTNDLEEMELRPGIDVMLGTLDELPSLVNLLLANSELAERVGENGRKHIAEHYSIESIRAPLFRFVYQFLPER